MKTIEYILEGTYLREEDVDYKIDELEEIWRNPNGDNYWTSVKRFLNYVRNLNMNLLSAAQKDWVDKIKFRVERN